MSLPWRELANTLCLRRNLESAGVHPRDIGSRGSGNAWQTAQQRKEALDRSRRDHALWSRALREQHDVKTAAQLAARIHDLRQQEERLWKLCRPDLYHAQQ